MKTNEQNALFEEEIKKVETLYANILENEHHVSTSHRRMSREERAAQFGAFAALTGHYEALAERARTTEEQRTVEKDVKTILDHKLMDLKMQEKAATMLKVTFFKPDEKKNGGAYVTMSSIVKRFDDVEAVMIFENGERVPYSYVIDVNVLM